MKIETFIKEYQSVADKDIYLKSHIKTQYIPYEKKVALCQSIIDSSFYTVIGDKRIFRQNTPVRNELFNLTLVREYTDIDLDLDGESLLAAFNLLLETKIMGVILSSIPESEFVEMNTILEMMIDDVIANERDIVSYIENKINSLSVLAEELLPEVLAKLTEEEK